MPIRNVSHIGLYTPDLERAVQWYTRLLGLEVTDRNDGEVYLSCDVNHHGLVLYRSDCKGVHHFGFEVDGEKGMGELIHRLQSHGIKWSEVREPGEKTTIEFQDPSGFTVRAFYGMAKRYTEPRFASWYPRKFGHITAKVKDIKSQVEFYEKVLGFKVSDWMADKFVWMRCSPDHHGVAWAQSHENALHHLAWEVQDWSALRVLADHFLNHGVRILYGPGRHGPGYNLFMYVRNSDGIINELFCDILQIWHDDQYEPKVWPDQPETINQWGPAPPPEFLEG